MNTVPKQVDHALINGIPAANADRLAEQTHVPTPAVESTGGWDAYEVWNRFIKEARERRRAENHPL